MWLTALLSLIPQIVTGVEAIHGEAKSGADKKQMAMDALKLAVAGAASAVPGQIGAIDAAGGLASNVIDGTVALFNKIGWPHKAASAKRFTVPVK
jgi:hypothetical protein